MPSDADRDLERLFHGARATDARRAPSFARVLQGRRPAPRRAWWPALAGGVALVAIVAVWRLTNTPESPFAIRPGELRVPTDFLLDLVTLPRAGEIPRVGVVDWYPLESTANNRREQ